MKKILVFIILFSSFSIGAVEMCLADSVITYRVLSNTREVASIEYFEFDQNDSLIKNVLIDVVGGIRTPVYLKEIARKKIKNQFHVEEVLKLWNAEKNSYSTYSKSVTVYDKKGVILSKNYFDAVQKGSNPIEFVPQSKTDYFYLKGGLLLFQESFVWDKAQGGSWKKTTKELFDYNELGQKLNVIFMEVDTASETLKETVKIYFTYDAAFQLKETIRYKIINGVWLPDERNSFGEFHDGPMTYHHVQYWRCDINDWDNSRYFVFQHGEDGRVESEVHLTWRNTEWKIDVSVFYGYDENGKLSQLLNENKQLVVQRFCR